MSYENHLRDYEMGQAYKLITSQMGPSPQLVAFVGYENVGLENCGLESMDIMTQHEKILSEIDALDDTALESFESADDLMLADGNDLFQFSEEIDQLEGAYEVVQVHGINPSSYGIMKATHLLAGTSLEAIAIEDLGSGGPEDYQSKMALEGIMDKIKEKSAAWSAKILNFVKRISEMSFKEIGAKIVASAKVAADKVKDLGRTIKAHPYKSALIAFGGIAATAAAIALIGQKLGAPNADIEKVIIEAQQLVTKSQIADGKARNFTVFSMFDSPIGNKALQGVDFKGASKAQNEVNALYRTARFHAEFAGAAHLVGETPTVGTLQELGWTQQNIISMGSKITSLTSQVTSALSTFVKGATTYLSNHSGSVATEALQIPGVSKKSSHRIITSLFWAVYRLVKTKIGGGYHILASLMLRLAGH